MGPHAAVLITGTSTGIGAACALRLVQAGYLVFAGVRRAEDGEALAREAGPALRWISLDVTDARTIARAVEEVEKVVGERGLAGLVNNAGIAIGGPLESLPVDDLRRQLEVNVIGLHAVTRAFLPLVRRARGRVIHIGSISGRIASPFVGAYSASKHAVEALTDALRLELAPEGIHVAVIEPGQVRTPIWEKGRDAFDRLDDGLSPESRERYAGRLRAIRYILERARLHAAPPSTVAEAVQHALESGEPRTRYVIGKDARVRLWLTRLLPDRAMDALLLRALARLETRAT